jgi:hypothetical protein
MSTYCKYGAWIASAILACLVPTSTYAAPLPCVQRAINWNNANATNNANVVNSVFFALVALHEIGEGAYAYGTLANSNCTRKPYAAGTVSCLITKPTPVNAQLLRPSFGTLNSLLRLSVEAIPSDNLAQVHMRQPNATYDFDPVCVGNFLVGSDQWGNRWTISFSLTQTVAPK